MATSYTEEERNQLVSVFETLDVKPKMDNPDDLRKWMTDFVKGQGRMEDQSDHGKPQGTGTVSTHVVHDPKVSTFSGGTNTKDVSYETWKYEINTLLEEGVHKTEQVTSAAKKSLRGDAAKVVRRLGVHANIEVILKKLDGIYGTLEDTEDLLGKFYSTQQYPDESVASWGCRLEDLLDRASHDQPLATQSMNDMLRTKFWNGLLPHLREPMRNKAEVIVDFDDLRIAARKIENEHPNLGKPVKETEKPKRAQVKMVSVEPDTQSSELETLKGLVCSLTTKVDALQHNFGSHTYRPKYSGNRQPPKQWNNRTTHEFSNDKESSKRPPVTCFRCGQLGHLTRGCRVELTDEKKNTLNWKG